MPNRKKDPEKTVDLPPTGSRNADPSSGTPGSHPIETGVGTAIGGMASGLAVGAALGPIGAVAGAIIGGVAGGLAGKGVGEIIDPTTEDNWLRESFTEKKYVKKGDTFDTYLPAYRYAAQANHKYEGKAFTEVEPHLKKEWDTARGDSSLTWSHAKDAVRDAYDRTLQLREERLNVTKTPVQTGEAKIRKEVVSETKTIEVPVEREEIVIERRAVHGKGVVGDIKAEEIRIPVKEEQVHVSKETVVKEEVSVGKRKVHDTKHVADTVKHEELKVEEHGAKVRQTGGTTTKSTTKKS